MSNVCPGMRNIHFSMICNKHSTGCIYYMSSWQTCFFKKKHLDDRPVLLIDGSSGS